MNKTDRTREEIFKELYSSSPGEKLPPIALHLMLEVLIDIRDALNRIESKEGVPKWGPKL